MTVDDSKKFNIGVSRKLLNTDMTAVIAEFDFSLLLENQAIQLSTLPDIETGELSASDIQDLDAAILFLEKVTRETLTDSDRISVFARYGVGFDTLDIPACTESHVAVAIAPDGVRRPVATTVIALLLALTLNMKKKDRLARDIPDGWAIKSNFNGTGLVGRTLGIVGLNNIGAEVARLIAPFDMRVVAYDPIVTPDAMRKLGVSWVDLDMLFKESDIVSLNCPLNDSSFHLVNSDRLASMKDGSYLINTARGSVVDENALIDALQSGKLAGAGLDVFETEPPSPDNPLLKMDNVILAPHALCFTDQCLGGLGEADVKACLSVMHGRVPDTLVNPEVIDSPRFKAKLERYANAFKAVANR